MLENLSSRICVKQILENRINILIALISQNRQCYEAMLTKFLTLMSICKSLNLSIHALEDIKYDF